MVFLVWGLSILLTYSACAECGGSLPIRVSGTGTGVQGIWRPVGRWAWDCLIERMEPEMAEWSEQSKRNSSCFPPGVSTTPLQTPQKKQHGNRCLEQARREREAF